LPTPLGFAFDRNANLLTTELFGSATSIPKGGAGALSSFSIDRIGDLTAISSHVGDNGTAASFITVEPITGRFAYVANNLSASISSYSVSNAGTVVLIDGAANQGTVTAGPNDMATAQDGGSSFLYVVNAGTGTVGAFQINLVDGSLTALSGGMGLPAGRSAQGLAAY
jgi:6-phosphogluconolactonase (cycloisomerase 2 family)